MKRKTIILSVLFVLTTGMVSAQVFKNDELAITKLEDRRWVVETADNSTMYIVEGKDRAMLIDTGRKNEKLDSIIRLITQKPLLVVLTHAHGDHAGNIRFFNEIYIHPADTAMLDKTYKGKINLLKDGEIFDLGEKKIEVCHLPAHTPGSVVFLDREAGIVFSGDAFGSGQVWLQMEPFSPMKTYIRSLNKMKKLIDKGITKNYCGHYPYVKKPYDKSYIDTMLKLAIAIDKGAAPNPKPFTNGGNRWPNALIVSEGEASIVYDPNHVK
ncbi:MAG TPA: MBL fold metallo-hydrolase [Prolixibacteraceae bacterium]|nr:MBL fold metallo-hydrolase [Prolixibacteraceae bacterium]